MTIRERALEELDQTFGICLTVWSARPGEDCARGVLNAGYWIPTLVKFAAMPNAVIQLQGIRSVFHRDLGPMRIEFRTFRGKLAAGGKGSLQLVINPETGEFYADIDKFNPEQDVYNFLGHVIVDCAIDDYGKRAWRRVFGGK